MMRSNKSIRRMRRLSVTLPCWLFMALAVLGESAGAEPTPRDLIRQGNEHYAAGRYQEALESYAQAEAASEETPSAELLHDQAAAKYRLGQFDDARDLWGRARPLGDAGFEARTRYNLGNCDYAEALNTLQGQDASQAQGMNKAVELLGKAAEHYRDAVGLDPTLADARANLELTHLLKKQIEEQMEQQQDQQGQQGEQGDQDNEDQQPQPSSQPSDQEQQQQQPNEQDEQSESQEQQGQQQEQDPNQAAGMPEPESQPAEQAGEEGADEQRPPIEMTEQQAERLLQMVRDAEKQRREMLARRRQARYKPVERDW